MVHLGEQGGESFEGDKILKRTLKIIYMITFFILLANFERNQSMHAEAPIVGGGDERERCPYEMDKIYVEKWGYLQRLYF